VTVGEAVGTDGCTVPTCGLDWIGTPQPIALDHWPAVALSGGPMSSVGSWRGPYGPVEFDGVVYGLRVHEFRRFVALPRRTGLTCELALDIDPWDEADRAALRDAGWRLVDPLAVAGGLTDYRDYVRRSGGEFATAKGMYVQSRCGWFSDRSICYLASGRPVLAQDTGLGEASGAGAGLLTFATLDEAVDGAEQLAAEPRRHAAAARALAEERFDARRVLPRLIERLGVA
jgi:hypothetical protein